MAKKDEDINLGFKIGDTIKNKKGTIQGKITGFEWSGSRKALVPIGESSSGTFVLDLRDIEIIAREEEPKEIKPAPITTTTTGEEK